MRDPENKVVYINDMDLDTPPQLGWRENKKEWAAEVHTGPFVLCKNRPSCLYGEIVSTEMCAEE
jgi:hypothetical protein